MLLLVWSVQVFIIHPEGKDRRQDLYRRFLPQQSTFLRISTLVPNNINLRLSLLAPFDPSVQPPKSLITIFMRLSIYQSNYHCKSRQSPFEVKGFTLFVYEPQTRHLKQKLVISDKTSANLLSLRHSKKPQPPRIKK